MLNFILFNNYNLNGILIFPNKVRISKYPISLIFNFFQFLSFETIDNAFTMLNETGTRILTALLIFNVILPVFAFNNFLPETNTLNRLEEIEKNTGVRFWIFKLSITLLNPAKLIPDNDILGNFGTLTLKDCCIGTSSFLDATLT